MYSLMCNQTKIAAHIIKIHTHSFVSRLSFFIGNGLLRPALVFGFLRGGKADSLDVMERVLACIR